MTPWEILGIPPDADKNQIKRAYSKLIKENRPDDAPEAFQLIRDAYEQMLENLPDQKGAPDNLASMTMAVSPTPSSGESGNDHDTHGENRTETPIDHLAQQVAGSESVLDTPEDSASVVNDLTSSSDTPDPVSDSDQETINVADQTNEFIARFERLISNFPDNGKLSSRDLELCRQDTVNLMRHEVLNHFHAREHLAQSVFDSLCRNIAVSSGLLSTTTNFPGQFLQYLDDQFLWTENEVTLCENCEDDSANLVFYSIHEGKKNGLPNWSELPDEIVEAEPPGISMSSVLKSWFKRPG